LGRVGYFQKMVDTGPCADEKYNWERVAGALEALGGPGPPGPPGPPNADGTPGKDASAIDNVYVQDSGELVYVDRNGELVVIGIEGTGGGNVSTATFYLKVSGKVTGPLTPPIGSDPDDRVTHDTTSFWLSDLTVLESMTVHIPYDSGLTGTLEVPDVSGSILVQNSPKLRTALNTTITARYHSSGKWFTDSLDNWEEHARGRASWNKSIAQVLRHGAGSSGISWGEAGTVVVSVTQAAPASEVNGVWQAGPGSGFLMVNSSGITWTNVESIVIYNLSRTGINVSSPSVLMTATLVGGSYILNWPDLVGMEGFNLTDPAQIPYHEVDQYNFQLAGEVCD